MPAFAPCPLSPIAASVCLALLACAAPRAASGEEEPEAARRDVPRVNLPPYPRVFRNFMPESGPSAFAVELAEGLTLIYDPLRGGINAAWIGEIDLAPTVQAKINDTAVVVGEVFYREAMRQPLRRAAATGEEPERRFKGYRYEDGAVVFESTIDGILVSETLRALPGGRGFERTIAPEPGGEVLAFLTEAMESFGGGTATLWAGGTSEDSAEMLVDAQSPLVQRVSAEDTAEDTDEARPEPATTPPPAG